MKHIIVSLIILISLPLFAQTSILSRTQVRQITQELKLPRQSVLSCSKAIPKGTKVLQSDRVLFITPEPGAILFIDYYPELDWAHDAALLFLPTNTESKREVIVQGSMLPGFSFTTADGKSVDTQWTKIQK